MNDSMLRIKVWTKLILLALVVLFVLLFTYENYSRTATVWFFRDHDMTVLELLAVTFFVGVAVTLLARPTYHTLGQIALLRKKTPEAAVTLPPAGPAATPPPVPTPAPKS
jgi:hypothetical protein